MNQNYLSNAYESILNKKQEKKPPKLAGTFWIGSKYFHVLKDCLLWKLC